MRGYLVLGVAAILSLRTGQSQALGSNNSTGWIWDEGQGGAVKAAGMDLRRWGATFGGIDVAEFLSNVRGGTARTTAFDNVLALEANLELGQAIGWPHALIHGSAFHVRAPGLSAALDSNPLTVSNIEADATTELHELWIEQLLADRTVSIRVGQIAADSEFAVSGIAALFLNGSHGWPALFSADLAGGGPAYPLASPAVRIAWLPSGRFSIATGVYSNVMQFPTDTSTTAQPPRSADFQLGTGALIFSEARYSPASSALPESVRVGYWHDSGTQDNPGSLDHGSVAGPNLSGFYFMLDKTVAQMGQASLACFARGFFASTRRVAVSEFFDAGIELVRLRSAHSADAFGAAVALAVPGDGTSHDGSPPQNHLRQADLELTYRLMVNEAWAVQPDIQYLIHPGTRTDDTGANVQIPDSLVVGVRISYEF